MTVARFWREQKNRYNLLGTKCGNCNKIFFPPEEMCEDCHRSSLGKMEEVKLKGDGKIVSYTVIHEGADAFKTQIPYVLAIIELDEGPRVTGQIVGVSSDVTEENPGTKNTTMNPAIDGRVSSVFRKISEDGKSGIIHYGYKFKMAKNNSN